MKNGIGALGAMFLLAGCVANAEQVPEDPLVWGRVDCQRLADNPILQVDFEQAKTICSSRGQAASIGVTAGMPNGYGIAGGLAAGINKGITGSQIGAATVNGCMGEMGYLFKAKSEHLAMCDAVQAQRQRMAAQNPPPPPARKRVVAPPSTGLSAVVNTPARPAPPQPLPGT